MDKETRAIVRVSGTDLDGFKPIERALWKIRGISHMMAHAIRISGKFDKKTKLGDLNEKDGCSFISG